MAGMSGVGPSSPGHGTARRLGHVLLIALVAAAMLPLTATPASAGSVYYVDDDGDNDTGNGTSSKPWRTIELAMSNATAGDTIKVKPGTYVYEPAGLQDFPINLAPGVRLVSTGGSAVTTITAAGSGQPVISITDPLAGSEVSGFTLTGGGAVNGAGIRITRTGGGTLEGWPLITDNVITGNGGGGPVDGAGIHMQGASGSLCAPLIEDNRFEGNTGGDCAGITAAEYSNPTIRGNGFFWGTSSGVGGIALVGADTGGTIADNMIISNSGRGIHASPTDPGPIVISGNSISANSLASSGAGLFLSSGTYTLERNQITGNSTGGLGGGIYATNAFVYSTNDLIQGNTGSTTGGAAYAQDAFISLNACTIYGNMSSSGWAGLSVGGAGSYSVRNSILWGHGDEDVTGATIEYSDVEDPDPQNIGNTVGGGVIHDDPQFRMDGYNGLYLAAGSPCIDSASPTSSPDVDIDLLPRPQDGDASGSAGFDMGFAEYPEPIVDRFSGSNRYDTACRIVREWFDSAETAVIASGEDFPDALSAAGLAGTYHAPLLLTEPDAVPSVVANTLADLGVDDVIIIGGESAVSPGVASTLASSYTVSRISGANRYDTAARVAREIARIEGLEDHWNGWVFVARGDDFPDALSLAPISYFAGHGDDGCPILLTETGELPTATSDALEDLGVHHAYIAGGTSAVSAPVMSDIAAICTANSPGWNETARWKGDDRYETAVAIANGGYATFLDNPQYAGLATGVDFPDALAGAVAAGVASDGVVLLTKPDALPSATRNMLSTHKNDYLWVEIYGGEGAVASDVRDAVDAAMGW